MSPHRLRGRCLRAKIRIRQEPRSEQKDLRVPIVRGNPQRTVARVFRAEHPAAVVCFRCRESVIPTPLDHAIDFGDKLPVTLCRKVMASRLVGVEPQHPRQLRAANGTERGTGVFMAVPAIPSLTEPAGLSVDPFEQLRRSSGAQMATVLHLPRTGRRGPGVARW